MLYPIELFPQGCSSFRAVDGDESRIRTYAACEPSRSGPWRGTEESGWEVHYLRSMFPVLYH